MSSAQEKRVKTQIVYVAASVTNASAKAHLFLHEFKHELRAQTGALVLEWQDDRADAVPDFFSRNLQNVSMCHIMIALINEPSIGVGLEIAEAVKERKHILCLHQEHTLVSRLLLSAAKPLRIAIREYRTKREAVELAAQFIEQYEHTA